MKSVVVIGGGVIGLCSAFFLRKEGCDVTIIDQSNMDQGASYVNAGYISPSHIVPLAAPGVMKQGLKWMFNSASPLYIKPRLQKEFLQWAWAFSRSCSQKNVESSIAAIKDISTLSVDLFAELKETDGFSFQYENKGLLMLCQTHKALEKEIEVARLAQLYGLEATELSAQQLQVMEPNAPMNVIGATHYQCDWHSTPTEFMANMKRWLVEHGVRIQANEKIVDMTVSNFNISEIHTTSKTYTADSFVLAAGSWSSQLSSKLGINLRLQAGKGYRINSFQHTQITVPAVLSESKVAVTPMNGFTRYAGTMEIAGINHSIRSERVNAIANAVKKYYPDVQIHQDEKDAAACGLRPVTPDGRPYIGASDKCKNLIIATGHGMMGWSMSTATGKLVSECITHKTPSINMNAFHPDRSF